MPKPTIEKPTPAPAKRRLPRLSKVAPTVAGTPWTLTVNRGSIKDMPWLNIVLLLYALLNIAMGLMGYFRANSVWSLVAGVGCGLIVLVTILLTRFKPRTARITALVVALLLVGRFAPKTFQNQLYPAGVMFVSSLAVAFCLLAGHMVGMKERKAREAAAEPIAK